MENKQIKKEKYYERLNNIRISILQDTLECLLSEESALLESIDEVKENGLDTTDKYTKYCIYNANLEIVRTKISIINNKKNSLKEAV